jgi:hypothetical protein
MPDISIIATVITTAGTLGGALGGITLTNWTGIRREELQAERQRAHAREDARHSAHAELLSASAQLRVHVEITCEQQWPDLDARLTTAQEHAATIGLHAARSALLSSAAPADAALTLAAAARKLVARLTSNAEIERDFSGPGERFRRGVVAAKPDFTEFDACFAEFLRLASASKAS